MAAPGIIDQSVLSEIAIPRSNPDKGKRALRAPLDFSANSAYTFNLLLQQFQDVISAVTCLYIDNASNDHAVTINVNITQQRIVAQPGSQGYYAVLVPSTFAFEISSPGSSASINLYLLNFTPSNNVWTSAITSVIVSGSVSVTNFPAVQAVSGTVAVSNFPATQPISGSVSVTNFPPTQAVSGTVAVSNFPATQNVNITGGLANPLPVSVGNFPATQPVSGTVAVSNFPATQPVSGAVSVSNFPATQVPTQQNSGDVQKPWYAGNKAVKSSLSTQGSNTIITGANYYVVTAFTFNTDLTSTNSLGGSILVRLTDSTDGIIAELIVFLPATTVLPGIPGLLTVPNPSGFFYHSTTSGSHLSFIVAGGGTINVLISAVVSYALTNVAG